MLGRVTQRSIAQSSLANLQAAAARTAQLQDEMTSGKSLNKGSDDSVKAAAALRLNDQITVNAQNSQNVTDARGWTSTQEGALTSTVDTLQSIRGLVVQAGDGAYGPNDLKAIADQIREAKNTILGDSNTQYQGRAVFSGTTNTTVAYVASTTTPTTYTSNDDGKQVTRTVSPGVNMTVNVSGDSVYGTIPGATTAPGNQTLFAQLDQLADDIQAGNVNTSTTTLGVIDARINMTTSALGKIGAKDNQLDHADDVNSSQLEYLKSQLDDVQGLDMAKAMVDFTMQNTAYQAALATTAKVIQPTLLDFLR